MNFDATPEQVQLAASLRRWCERNYSFETRRAIVASAPGVSAPAWQGLCELGLTALAVPAAHGGFDGSAADLLALLQETGRAQLVEPYLATAWGTLVLRLAARQAAPPPSLAARLGPVLGAVAGEGLMLACAFGERHARYDYFDIATCARAGVDGFTLDGEKTVVVHGAQAAQLIVSARVDGEARPGLFLVDGDGAGVARSDYRTIDGQRAADIGFAQAPAHRLDAPGQGAALLEAALDHGAGLLCFEALGALDALFEATLAYLKTRTQFGVAIGSFQALQHRMADMLVEREQARSMALLAAAWLDRDDALLRRRAVSAAKARIGTAATLIGQQAVQLHGGMGVTDELPVGAYFKRLTVIGASLGDVDHHLARFIATPGFAPAQP